MSSRRQYPFHLIEPKWQQHWDAEQTFRAWNPGEVLPSGHPFAQRHQLEGRAVTAGELPPKFYILDMFPYPSGAGLHVGHPEGYTATDILARYRRAQGFNVLHPMGWDSFGLPAEQYAVKTGQHPRVTTEANIANFTRQIKSLGFSYDWSRELATTDPDYFRWTQWIFLKLYNSWFNPETNKAEPIETLKEKDLYKMVARLGDQRAFLDNHRLAYVTEAPVWWCEELGTVLANEEVVDGKSEVGGFTVVKKPMRQWMLRITDYAEKLRDDLDTIEWSDSLKEMQRNWIGKSDGAELVFEIAYYPPGDSTKRLPIFTTRPDTLFGATYMVIAPEHWLTKWVKLSNWPKDTPDSWKQGGVFSDIPESPKDAIERYQAYASTKSDLERTDLAKEKSGVFTGLYAINPVNDEKIPIWIADYVLATYGTGAIMAVPAHDQRDYEFAIKFGLPIKQVVLPQKNLNKVTQQDIEKLLNKEYGQVVDDFPHNEKSQQWSIFGSGNAFEKEGVAVASGFLDGLPTADAKAKITAWLEEKNLGKKTINYKLRDWLFSRQRYWGEPFPIVWKHDASGNLYHEALPESALPLLPPPLDDYKPTADGQPPLARAKDWVTLPDGSVRETNTMPQWAGSCWYYLRFLDAKNSGAFVGNEAERYWMGAAAINSVAANVSSLQSNCQSGLTSAATPGVDLYVGGTEHAVLHLLYARFWHKVLFDLGHVSTPEPFFKLVNQGLILGEDGQKMSKSRGNVVNPDDVLGEYGADAFRLYEMFMGPLEMVKPWNTKGVEGVYRFLGRVWRLYVDEASETEFEQAETTAGSREELLKLIKLNTAIQDVPATPAQLKTLHACIKKVTEDLDALRFNTAISAMMVFVNDAITWDVKPWCVMREFLQLLAPFAPHLAEELWDKLHSALRVPRSALSYAPWPKFDPALLVESTLEIPVQVNGKLRGRITVPADLPQAQLEATALACPDAQPFLDGKTVKKIIVVPKKLVNIVVA